MSPGHQRRSPRHPISIVVVVIVITLDFSSLSQGYDRMEGWDSLSSSFSRAVFPTQGTEGPSSTNHNDKNITRGTAEYIAFCFSTWVVVTQSLLLFFKLCIPICSLAYAFHGKKIKLKNCQS